MPYTHKIVQSYRAGTLQLAEKTIELTGDGEINRTVAAPGAATTEVVLEVDVSTMVGLIVRSTKAVTLKANSAGAPTFTVEVGEGHAGAVVWGTGLGTNPFTADITANLFITNAGASPADDAVVIISILFDATP